MFKTLSLLSIFVISSNLMAMSEEQFDRYANAQSELRERAYRKELEQKKCLSENILDASGSSVKSVKVKTLRFRTLPEQLITFNVSNYQIEFDFVLDQKTVSVSCGLWSKGSKSLKNDLIQLCYSQGKKLDLIKYIPYVTAGENWFVISRGCMGN